MKKKCETAETCRCCRGSESVTPEDNYNRPGLDSIRYRAGTHGSFFETMITRLSSSDYPSLAGLTSRERDDPSIALLDGWATVADVLTFYQERIANEGFIRTASERRSILELAGLVGYRLRPGVASSVFLAYTLDNSSTSDVVIPQGSRVMSIPAPGENAQSFETSEDLTARKEWNAIKPQMSRPQWITLDTILSINTVYFEGTALNIKVNDRILFDFGDGANQKAIRLVQEAKSNYEKNYTEVTLQNIPPGLAAIVPYFRNALNIALEDGNDSPVKKVMDDYILSLLLGNVNDIKIIQNYNAPNSDFALLISNFTQLLFFILTNLPPNENSLNFLRESLLKPLNNNLNNRSTRNEIINEFSHDLSSLGNPKPLKERKPFFSGCILLSQFNDQWINYCKPLQDTIIEIFTHLFSNSEFYSLFKKLFNDDCKNITELNNINWILNLNSEGSGSPSSEKTVSSQINSLVNTLEIYPNIQLSDGIQLKRDSSDSMTGSSDIIPQFFIHSSPILQNAFYPAYANALRIGSPELRSVQVMRLSSSLFGHNAPLKMKFEKNNYPGSKDIIKYIQGKGDDWNPDEFPDILYLDNAYDSLIPGSYAIIQITGRNPVVVKINSVEIQSRAEYSLSGKTTKLSLPPGSWSWEKIDQVRSTIVYAQSERLSLVFEPIEEDIGESDIIPLDGLYDHLSIGKWVVVAGERVIEGTSGVPAAELVMITGVTHVCDQNIKDGIPLDIPGSKIHTVLTLNTPLAYRYKRETVKVYGNVVKATHGETKSEVLGSGDTSKVFQAFPLKQAPLTYTAASTPSGAANSLEVRINDVLWHESDTLVRTAPSDRLFITSTDNAGKTSVIFGDGREGLRPPSGTENIRARYRTGIGNEGNVRAGQISLLMTKPLGVQGVINPLPATGGADRESRDLARKNAPLAVQALDRLVSVDDYAAFAVSFAGIGKARAVKLSDKIREIVYITIAGMDDIPIDESSDLYRNLVRAMQRYGDPRQPFLVKNRELMSLIIQANVKVLPDNEWKMVEPKVRAALLDAFSFNRRDLGQDVLYKDVLCTIQAVEGVDYVDIDVMDAASKDDILGFLEFPCGSDLLTYLNSLRFSCEKTTDYFKPDLPLKRIFVRSAVWDTDKKTILPDQLAVLCPDIPDSLILNEVI